jgi:sucrose phosphorylase
MSDVIAEHLTFLYGSAQARTVEARLRRLLQEHSPRVQTAGRPLSERDSVLITYGDQVREPGTPPLRTLGAFLDRHLAGVVSGVHVLPFYPSSSDDGFSVVDYRAVDPTLGTWEDVCRIGSRFELMFDAVFNHVSASSGWFRRFLAGDPEYRGWFVTVEGDPDLSQVVRPRALPLLTTFETPTGPRRVWTTFSADQVDLDVRNPDVLLALLDVLLFYVAMGARFIRLDAIAYLWKEIGTPSIHLPQTHRVVQLMRSVLDRVAPHVLLITETNVPHADNVSYFGDGTNEAQLVYNFALPPLVLHTLATGSAEALAGWATELATPSDRVTFFNFLASHDGIGVNPVRGILAGEEIDALVQRAQEHGGFVSFKQNPDGSKSPYELNVNYFDALSNPTLDEPLETQVGRFLVAHAIQLAMAGLPAVYFHSLFGSRGDRAGAEASGIPRRVNRQKCGLAELERELGEPGSRRSRVLAGLTAMLRLRQASPAFHPFGRQEVLVTDPRVFALRRVSPDGRHRALCLHNVSNQPVHAGDLDLAPYEVRWTSG